jgi:hypothetical protein
MNAARSPQSRSQHPSQKPAGVGYPFGHSRRDDQQVGFDRLGIAAGAPWCSKGAHRPTDLTPQRPRSNKIRSDGDQILKPTVGIFPQIPHNDLPWLRPGLRQKSNLVDASNV